MKEPNLTAHRLQSDLGLAAGPNGEDQTLYNR